MSTKLQIKSLYGMYHILISEEVTN